MVKKSYFFSVGPNRRFAILAAVLLAISAALTAYLSPWMRAGTHPLIVGAKASENVSIEAVLPDGWHAPLVKTTDGEYVTELPPRREYTLFLKAVDGDCEIVSVEILKLDEKPVGKLLSWKAGEYPVIVKGGDTREFADDLPVSGGCFSRAFIGIFSFLSLIAFGFWALINTKVEHDAHDHEPRGLKLWQWTVVLALAFVHFWLVFTATPVFWPADSIGYAAKAMAFYNHGAYSTGEGYYEITRLPGAPLVEALAWKLFGFSVGSVAILQGLIFCAAAAFAIDALARAASPVAATIAAPFVFLSPPALQNDRIFSSESVYFSCALVASACLLRLAISDGRRRYGWAVLAGIFISYAAMTRTSGMIMLAFPIFMLGRAVAKLATDRAVPKISACAPWIIPIALVGLALLGWAMRNEIVLDRFAISDIKGLSAAEACFKNGILDVRASADDEALYSEIEIGRRASGYYFEAWALASLYQKRIAEAGPVDRHAPVKADALLDGFALRTARAVTWQTKIARDIRIFNWGTFVGSDANFQQFGAPGYSFVRYDDKTWEYTNSLISGWIDRDLVYPQRGIGPAQKIWNRAQSLFKMLFPAIAAAALAMFVLSAINGWITPMIFFMPYFGNILLNAWVGVVISRLVLVLEPLLWIGMALAIHECVKTAQKVTPIPRRQHPR